MDRKERSINVRITYMQKDLGSLLVNTKKGARTLSNPCQYTKVFWFAYTQLLRTFLILILPSPLFNRTLYWWQLVCCFAERERKEHNQTNNHGIYILKKCWDWSNTIHPYRGISSSICLSEGPSLILSQWLYIFQDSFICFGIPNIIAQISPRKKGGISVTAYRE